LYFDLGSIGLLTWLIWVACTGANLAIEQQNTEPTTTPEPTVISATPEPTQSPPVPTPTQTSIPTQADGASDVQGYAIVTHVSASGKPGSYSFSVTVESPDTGCGQYADWWEVLSTDGELLYRRVLLHSHVNEQPFSRSGGPVGILSEDSLVFRAHMNTTGYGSTAMQGSVDSGFEQIELSWGFARDVETMEPLPTDCDF
jgi:hypothetical protein